jgi:gluconolactonase
VIERRTFWGGARCHDQGLKAEPERPSRVCPMDGKTRGASIVTDTFEEPNGLAFSPDEKTLCIIDAGLTQGGKTSVYAV